MGDRWGRRPVLLAGLVLFVAPSLMSALAPTAELMIVARLACGIAAAMIMPVTLSVITSSFPEADRSRAIGIWTAVAAGGGLLGMFAAAILIDVSSRRWLFAPVITSAGVAFVMAFTTVPNNKGDTEEPFDVGGSILAVGAVGGPALAIHEGPVRGWTHPVSLGLLIVGLASTAAVALWELRRREPLLDTYVCSPIGASVRERLGDLPTRITEAVAEGIGTAYVVTEGIEERTAILAAAKEAFVDGWSQAMWIGITVTVALFLFVLIRGPVNLGREG
jgi:MFS family permease